jgi:chloramphenicol O-acetyltransferase
MIIMPVSINVHHGLMDAFQVSKYIQLFENIMNESDKEEINNKPIQR